MSRSTISYQERNNNLLLAETVKLIGQMKDGNINVIECGIEICYRERMYYAQFGMFNIPQRDPDSWAAVHQQIRGGP